MMLTVRCALYQGWWSLIVSISVNNFAYFYAFHSLRVFVTSTHGDLSMHQDILSGLIAGQNVVLTCLNLLFLYYYSYSKYINSVNIAVF